MVHPIKVWELVSSMLPNLKKDCICSSIQNMFSPVPWETQLNELLYFQHKRVEENTSTAQPPTTKTSNE